MIKKQDTCIRMKGRCCKYEVIGEVTGEAEKEDTLSKVAVYQYITVSLEDEDAGYGYDEEESDEDEDFSGYRNTVIAVRALSLRQHAQIWNELTDSNLKKFSYREDVERRIYNSNEFQISEVVLAARKLGLI